MNKAGTIIDIIIIDDKNKDNNLVSLAIDEKELPLILKIAKRNQCSVTIFYNSEE